MNTAILSLNCVVARWNEVSRDEEESPQHEGLGEGIDSRGEDLQPEHLMGFHEIPASDAAVGDAGVDEHHQGCQQALVARDELQATGGRCCEAWRPTRCSGPS